MGRKKKKIEKPWCWYCGREFDDEKILIQHQKAKHFKCHICNKKLFTGPGLAIHVQSVHKETIDKIPGAIQGRDSIDVEVYGMEGIPQEYEGPSEPKAKKQAMAVPTTSGPMAGFPIPGMPGFPPQMPQFSGMPMQIPGMPMQVPYPTGQFFGARNQQFPAMAAAQMMKPPFPQAVPRFQGMQGFPAGIPNAANIPMPISIPTPSIPQAPATFSAYQRPISVPTMSAGGATHSEAPSLYNLSSTSTQSTAPNAQKSIGSRTRIVVPDENTSLEESMANRLDMLSQVRYH